MFVFIFGPLFIFVYSWYADSDKVLECLRKTFFIFLDTSAQFTITVAIAAIARLRQSAPFFEIAFIESLLTIQFLGLLSTALAAVFWFSGHDDVAWRIIVTMLYGLVDFSCFMVLVSYLHTSKALWNAIQELSTACQHYKTITPAFVYSKQNPPLFHTTAKKLLLDIGGNGRNDRLIIVGLAIAVICGICLVAFIVWWLYKQDLCPLVMKSIVCIMSLAFSIAGLALLGDMVRKRDVMRSVTREKFQDDEWGFGQVIALCLWVPFIIQLLFYGLKVWHLNGVIAPGPRDGAD